MFGEKIKELRLSLGLNQVEFGKKLPVSKQSVCNWENDNIQPSIDMLKKLAALFSVSTDYLLGLSQAEVLDVSDLPQPVVAHLQQLIADFRALSSSSSPAPPQKD